jgi:hypothetical protein
MHSLSQKAGQGALPDTPDTPDTDDNTNNEQGI